MQQKYTKVAVALHWIMAAFIFYVLFTGLFKGALPKGDLKSFLMDWHVWLGLTVFWLVFVRLGWRLTHPAPALPEGNALQNKAAHAAHVVLYFFMAAIPALGYLMINAKGRQVNYFGTLLPELLTKNVELGQTLKAFHEYFAYGLGLVLLLHILAALKHHFIDKDGLMDRMTLK